MTSMDTRFRIDESRVVHEILEHEVVVVHLDSGHYYILDGTAAVVWKRLAGGASVAEVVRALSLRYPGDAPRVGEAVPAFVGRLTEEGLLTALERPEPPAEPPDAPVVENPGASFEPPSLHRYTDMATLIQMDPIHDFDETGWPRRPAPRDPQEP